jgi:hypothetical protein
MTENQENNLNNRPYKLEIIFSTDYDNSETLPDETINVEQDPITKRYKIVSGKQRIDDLLDEILKALEMGIDAYRVYHGNVEFLPLRTGVNAH